MIERKGRAKLKDWIKVEQREDKKRRKRERTMKTNEQRGKRS